MKKQLDLRALLEDKVGAIEPDHVVMNSIETAERAVPKNLMYDAESTEFIPETKAVAVSGIRGLTVEEAKLFDDEITKYIDAVLVSGVDYGVIPHCNKPTLLKPGAEKIMNYLGLIARFEIVNRVEEYETAFFSYECKLFLLDYNGVVKGEGIGLANTREGKYAKQNGYSIQNVVLKMAKKRALVDAVLNVGSLSARFTQDLEDINVEDNTAIGKKEDDIKSNMNTSYNRATISDRPVTQKQLKYLESLMEQHRTSREAMNSYVSQKYGIEDYHQITGTIASQLIEKYKNIG